MRSTIRLLAALLLAVGLAACDDDGDDGDGASDASAASASASASDIGDATETAYPVTIEHAMGETTVEASPERIVSLNVQWTDAALALGVTPVAYMLDAASLEEEPYPWHAEAVAESTRIDANGAIPYEQIAAADPDLILVTFLGLEADVFSTLEDIAPTIGMLGDVDVDPWQDQVEVLGRVLGEEDEAAEVIADVEGRIADLATELPGLQGKTYVAANYIEGDGIYVIADPDDGASKLFYALGMVIAPAILELDGGGFGRVQLSEEQAGLLDADFVGVLSNGSDLDALPGWSDLTAVQTGAMVDFEFADVVGLNTPTPISVPYVMDLIRPALEAVADAP